MCVVAEIAAVSFVFSPGTSPLQPFSGFGRLAKATRRRSPRLNQNPKFKILSGALRVSTRIQNSFPVPGENHFIRKTWIPARPSFSHTCSRGVAIIIMVQPHGNMVLKSPGKLLMWPCAWSEPSIVLWPPRLVDRLRDRRIRCYPGTPTNAALKWASNVASQ